MSNTFVTGKLGSGKTLYAVQQIRDYLSQGRKVATNLDIHLDKMFSSKSKSTVTRLPDKPRVIDMEVIGTGCEDYNEDKFGLIVLDECTTWLNSRSWNDKERFSLINWFLHARKLRWDIIFLVQDVTTLDKQLLGSLLEYHVTCKQLSKVPVPLLGHFGVKFPICSIASRTYGYGSNAMKAGTETYKAKDLFSSYDTMQVFKDDLELMASGLVDMRASYTLISSEYLHRGIEKEKKPLGLLELLFKKKEKPLKPINPQVLELIQVMNEHLPRKNGYQTIWER